MSAFNRDEVAPVTSNRTEISLHGRLTMIDRAYARGNREACIQMVDDLYSLFDTHDQD